MEKKPGEFNREKLFKILRVVLVGGAVLVGLFIFFNYIFLWVLPFVLAYIIAFILQPVSKFLHRKLKIPEKLAAFIIILLFYALIGFLVFLIINRIINELYSLSQNYKIDSEALSEFLDGVLTRIENVLSGVPLWSDSNFIEEFYIQLDKMLNSVMTELGTFLVAKVPSIITSIVIKLPGFLISSLLTIISTFYIALDFNRINAFLMLQVPEKVRVGLTDVKNRFLEAIYKYLRAYAILIFITFSELTAGFLIIGIDYAFLLAIMISFIDILPILGTGTVLIPWGIFEIIRQNYFTGFALLILYATITVIRQVIEPKIVGKSIGLYPVVTLISLYCGFRALGIFGMFMFPVTILIIKNLNEEGKIKLWKNP